MTRVAADLHFPSAEDNFPSIPRLTPRDALVYEKIRRRITVQTVVGRCSYYGARPPCLSSPFHARGIMTSSCLSRLAVKHVIATTKAPRATEVSAATVVVE